VRTMTAEQSAVLAGSTRTTRLKVEVSPTTGGVFTEISAISVPGFVFNFVKDSTFKDGVDDPSATMDITLARNQFLFNASPLMTSSPLNAVSLLINLNYAVRVSAAVVPEGVTPTTSDYVKFFFGRVRDIKWGGSKNEIIISCADYTNELMSLWHSKRSLSFGTLAGDNIDTIMQGILTANTTGLATDGVTALPVTTPYLSTLYSVNGTLGTPFQPGDRASGSPKAKQYTQDQMQVYTALQQFSGQIGWLLKQRWQANIGDFRLVMFDPLRSNTTSLRTFTQSQYYDVVNIGLNLEEIRNYVTVCFTDTTGAAQAVIVPSPTNANAGAIASQLAYGIQWSQLASEATTGILTSTDALLLATNFLSDLAQPQVTVQLKVPFFWPAELCDIYTIGANGVDFDTDQKLAVVAIDHTMPAQGQWSTTLSFRGKPSGGVRMWFDRVQNFKRTIYGAGNSSLNAEGSVDNSNFGQSTRF
jgi:hypothetical protein